jgi:cytochrome oxidase assembly protein ShyY1
VSGPAPAGPLGTARAAVGLLRRPFWLRVTLVVVLLAVAFVFLGRWQLHRHEAKVVRNALVGANYTREPVALDAVLARPDVPLPADRQWTQVRVTGVYEPEHQVLVRNRPLDGEFGYEVVVPLRTPSGAALLVDRGWVPPGEKFVAPDAVPAAPAGTVTVVVRLRPGEPPLDRTPPPGQELRIDLGRLAAVAGGTVYRGAYGVLAAESPAPARAPAPLPRPDADLGPHLAYAVQWWAAAVAAFVLLGVYAVREVRGRGTPPGNGPRRETPRVRLGARRRSGPTDEEWEDAISG